MRGIKIPQYKFALKMQGRLMREGGRIFGDTTVFNSFLNFLTGEEYLQQLQQIEDWITNKVYS